MLHGTVPSQCDPAAVADSFGHAIRAPAVTWRVSSLDMLLGPRWPAEGHMNKVDSSSLASFTSPLYRLTTPAAREKSREQAYTYHSTTHPMHPARGVQKRPLPASFCRAGIAGFRWPGGSQLRGHPS